MKKTTLAMAAAILLAGCGESLNKKVPFEEVNIAEVVRDTMLYGFCGEGSAMNTLQIITDANDTITLNVAAAKDKNMVFGGYAVGDEMAVAVDKDTTMATMVINKSALHGNWVQPNPIDGSSETGISILKGGTAESIDQSSIVYKSWRLFNGKLQVVATRNDGIDLEEVLEFTIKKVTPDSLIIADSEDTYEYGRQTFKPEEDLGIELDEGSEEDFSI
ncbi:MAG: hypothetical protein IKR50_08690 [Prevotella sp.]|nr:hypothetical protein [Prevotella sp.]